MFSKIYLEQLTVCISRCFPFHLRSIYGNLLVRVAAAFGLFITVSIHSLVEQDVLYHSNWFDLNVADEPQECWLTLLLLLLYTFFSNETNRSL